MRCSDSDAAPTPAEAERLRVLAERYAELERLHDLPPPPVKRFSTEAAPWHLDAREPAERPPLLRLGLPDRYVALAVSAYDQAKLSECELAEFLGTDIVTARAVYQELSGARGAEQPQRHER